MRRAGSANWLVGLVLAAALLAAGCDVDPLAWSPWARPTPAPPPRASPRPTPPPPPTLPSAPTMPNGQPWPVLGAGIDRRGLDELVAALPRQDVAGRVVDAAGAPVAGAEVFLCFSAGVHGVRDRLAGRVKSAADGSFRFQHALYWDPLVSHDWNEDPARYAVIAFHSQQTERGLNFTVLLPGDPTSAVTVTLPFTADPRRRTTRFRIITLQDAQGRPVVGARLYLTQCQHAPQWRVDKSRFDRDRDEIEFHGDLGILSGKTDDTGRLAIPDAYGEAATGLCAAAPGFAGCEVGSSSGVRVLSPSARLEGRVTWPDGTPAGQVAVYLVCFGSRYAPPKYVTMTDQAGYYLLPDVAAAGWRSPWNADQPGADQPGDDKLGAWLEFEDLRPDSHCLATREQIRLAPGQRAVKDHQLPPAAIVQGMVIDDATSRPVPRMRLQYNSDWFGRTASDSAGLFRLRVSPGMPTWMSLVNSPRGEYLIETGCDTPPQALRTALVPEDVPGLILHTRLRPLRRLAGRVESAIPGAAGLPRFDVIEVTTAVGPGVRCAPDGAFELPWAPADRDFELLAASYVTGHEFAGWVHVARGANDVRLPVAPLDEKQARVVDQFGRPVARFRFDFSPLVDGLPGYRLRRQMTSDAQGSCTVPLVFGCSRYQASWWTGDPPAVNSLCDAGQTTVDLALARPGVPLALSVPLLDNTLSARLVDAASGRPVAPARIEIASLRRARMGTRWYGFPVQPDGTFVIDRLDTGTVTMSVTAPGYNAASFTIPSDGRDLQLKLEPLVAAEHDLSVDVADQNNRPVVGANVKLQLRIPGHKPGSNDLTTVTDARGAARFTWTPPPGTGQARLWTALICDASGCDFFLQSFDWNQQSYIRAVVKREATAFRGRVVDAQGRPIAGARLAIALSVSDPPPAGTTAQSDASGWFELRRVTFPVVQGSTRVPVVVTAPDYAGSLEYLASDNPTTQPTVTLQRGATVRGRLEVSDGGALVGPINVSTSGMYYGAARAVPAALPDGAFELTGLGAGIHRIDCSPSPARPGDPFILMAPARPPEIPLLTGQTRDVTVTLTRCWRVRGRVAGTIPQRLAMQYTRIQFQTDLRMDEIRLQPDGTWEAYLPEGPIGLSLWLANPLGDAVRLQTAQDRIVVARDPDKNVFQLDLADR